MKKLKKNQTAGKVKKDVPAKSTWKVKKSLPTDGGLTQVRVATIWKNQTSAGKDWFSLVLDTGERLSCFDPGVVFLAGGNPSKKVNNFDPPAVLEGKIVEKGGYKHFELPEEAKPASPRAQELQAETLRRSQEESDAISRMSILRTAAMLLEFEETKSKEKFRELVKMCEDYVFKGILQ